MNLQDVGAQLKLRWERFCESVPRPLSCLFCHGTRILWNGRRERSASVLTEYGMCHILQIPCRRVRCGSPNCQKSWSLRPPGLSPNRHYQLCAVARAVSSYLFATGATQARIAREFDCSERTVGRWVRWVGQVADPTALQGKILAAAGPVQALVLAPVRAVVDLGRKARTAIRRQFVPRAAEVIAQLEALGMALGLEPPGLRSVIERFIQDRATISTYARPLIPECAT